MAWQAMWNVTITKSWQILLFLTFFSSSLPLKLHNILPAVFCFCPAVFSLQVPFFFFWRFSPLLICFSPDLLAWWPRAIVKIWWNKQDSGPTPVWDRLNSWPSFFVFVLLLSCCSLQDLNNLHLRFSIKDNIWRFSTIIAPQSDL